MSNTRKLLLTFIPFIGLYWVRKYGNDIAINNPWLFMLSFIIQAIYLHLLTTVIPNT